MNKLSPNLEAIIKEVASKLEIPVVIVREVWDFSMRFTAERINVRDLRSIRHMHLGLYGVTDYNKSKNEFYSKKSGEYTEWVEEHNLGESEDKRKGREKSENMFKLSRKQIERVQKMRMSSGSKDQSSE